MITIIDYGIGNIGSIHNMLRKEGIPCQLGGTAEQILTATKIILPGNGAFDACMNSLRSSGLIEALNYQVLYNKIPCLGICVGAQMLGKCSEEGVAEGLGWIDMVVKQLPKTQGLSIPHMGWNYVKINKDLQSPFMDLDLSRFYFVHSYYMSLKNQDEILMTTNYGIEFACGVKKENIYGVQFHPEKSHKFGKKLFKDFASI